MSTKPAIRFREKEKEMHPMHATEDPPTLSTPPDFFCTLCGSFSKLNSADGKSELCLPKHHGWSEGVAWRPLCDVCDLHDYRWHKNCYRKEGHVQGEYDSKKWRAMTWREEICLVPNTFPDWVPLPTAPKRANASNRTASGLRFLKEVKEEPLVSKELEKEEETK